MRHVTLALVLIGFTATATAATAEPVVVKTSGTGFVPVEWVRYETCQVFTDKVVITKTYGGTDPNRVVLTEERSVSVTPSIRQVVASAASEALTETDNGLCDGPSSHIAATRGTADAGDDLVLFSTGGCGSPKQERDGPYSRMLRDIVGLYCPTTHDLDLP